ncbi:MAG: hypothetical protein H6905_01785 [Hyphomicrobiales bacterium]|nr:hypothetical protein [Hyphomicrobiales bacterium]
MKEAVVSIRPADGVSLHIVDNEALLVDESAQALYGLNTSAAFIWCGLEEGWDAERLADQYAAAFRCSRRDATEEVRRALDQWRGFNLFAAEGGASSAANYADVCVPELEPLAPAPRPSAAAQSVDYTILSQRYRVEFETEAHYRKVHPVLAQFVAEAGLAATDSVVQVATVCFDTDTIISVAGCQADRVRGDDGLAPAVKSALVIDAVNRHGFGFFLHAAVVRRDQACMLLPAAPGSGKTCMSLALARAGFAYQTDEIALLDGDALTVRGVPVCPCVKEDAWPVIRNLYPQIDGLEAHRRVDGKTVKYLPPPDVCDPGSALAWPVRWLVFPKYMPGSKTELAILSRVEGLRRLLEECLALRTPLDERTVGRLARWIAGIECRTLTFSSLDEAVGKLRDLCSQRLCD